MPFEDIKNSHGDVIGKRFSPDVAMFRLIAEIKRPESRNKDTDKILKELRLPKNIVKKWKDDHAEFDKDGVELKINQFEHWFNSMLSYTDESLPGMIHALGVEKALKGDFRFWKEMASATRATEPSMGTVKGISLRLGMENATEEELIHARDRLLRAHRGLENSEGTTVVELPDPEPGSSEDGTPTV